MLISYGDYSLSFAITGQSGSGAAFLTPSSAMADGRTGTVTAIRWTDGTQNTNSYVEITVTISDPLAATARQGVFGVCNCSLPAGTRVVMLPGSIAQRLVEGARGERSAWFLPAENSNTRVFRIFNDVNGAASIVAASEFAIGEIYLGRVVSLCTLAQSSPSAQLQDPTGYTRSDGGQLWQLMRKPYRQVQATLGRFTTAQVKGGTTSDIPAGDSAGSTIDLQTLRERLATTQVIAVCDTPSAGQGAGTVQSGIRYDQSFMQPNWMLARMTDAGNLTLDQWPRWSWQPQFQEAT
jgi:hypothetical protein